MAEGIESEQQLGFLVKHGCRFGQGYYFSVPIDWNEIGNMLASRGARVDEQRDAAERVAALAGGG